MANLWMITVLFFSFGVLLSNGHSWLDCVKDVGSGLRTSDADCRGYPRGYPGRVAGVNVDQIMTYRIQPKVMGVNPPICAATQRNPTDYTTRYYMASAKAGETLRMRWTPNGHQRGAGQDPLTYTIHWTGAPGSQLKNRLDLNDTNKLAGPFRFDETCYCNNCAGDPCYGTFTIPQNAKTGVYSFIWYWIFNRDAASGGEEYTTCFDVAVTGTANYVPPPPASSAVKPPSQSSSAQTSSAKTSNAASQNPDTSVASKDTDKVTPTLVVNNNNTEVDNVNGANGIFGIGLAIFALLAALF
jgi:hypothetical protein